MPGWRRDWRGSRGRFHGDLGYLLFKKGELPRALEEQRRALALSQRQTGAEALRDTHIILGDLARTLSATGAKAEALEHYRGAVAAAEARLALLPADPTARRDLNNGTSNLAEALRGAGQLAEATRAMSQVVAFDEEKLRADEKDAQAMADLAWDLDMMAQLAFDGGRFDEALALERRAHDLAAARLRQNPTSFQARKTVAEGWSELSDILAKLDRLDEAVAMEERAIAELEHLREQNPSQTRVAQLLAVARAAGAELYERTAQGARGPARAAAWRKARASSRLALQAWGELERLGALDADKRPRLAASAAVLVRSDAALARKEHRP